MLAAFTLCSKVDTTFPEPVFLIWGIEERVRWGQRQPEASGKPLPISEPPVPPLQNKCLPDKSEGRDPGRCSLWERTEHSVSAVGLPLAKAGC